MAAQFWDQIRTIEEQAPSHLFLSAKTEILMAIPSHFKILLAARIQTAVLSVPSEVWFCVMELQRHALFDATSLFEKGCLKRKSYQSTFICRIPYRFCITKPSSWEMTGRIPCGLWKLA